MNIKLDININLENVDYIMKNIKNILGSYNQTHSNRECEVALNTIDDNLENAKKITTNIISIDDIKDTMAKLSSIGRTSEIKEVLGKYNISRTTQIKEENMEAIYKSLNSLLNN